MYIPKVISRKTFFLNRFFVGVSKVNDENSMDAWIRGSGSVPKCHESATLEIYMTGLQIVPFCTSTGTISAVLRCSNSDLSRRCYMSKSKIISSYAEFIQNKFHSVVSSKLSVQYRFFGFNISFRIRV
jgi:hypothetical protein